MISGAVLQQGPAELHPGEKLSLIYRVRVEFICVPHESQPHFLKVWGIGRGKGFTSYGTLVQVSQQNTLTYAQIETRKCDPVRIKFRRTEFNEGNPIQAGTPSSFAISLKNAGKDDVHGVQFDEFYPTIGMEPYYNPNSFVCQNKNRIRFKVKVTCVPGEGRYCPPDGLPITFDRPADDAGSYMGYFTTSIPAGKEILPKYDQTITAEA